MRIVAPPRGGGALACKAAGSRGSNHPHDDWLVTGTQRGGAVGTRPGGTVAAPVGSWTRYQVGELRLANVPAWVISRKASPDGARTNTGVGVGLATSSSSPTL